MDNFWIEAIKTLGVAGLGAFVFYKLMRMIVPQIHGLTKRQRFWYLTTATSFGFVICMFGMGLYVWSQSGKPSRQQYLVKIFDDGKRLDEDFKVSVSSGDFHETRNGEDGVAQISVPASIGSVNEIRIDTPCYRQITDGPFRLAEGKDVEIEMRKITAPTPPPLPPPAYPVPENVIDPRAWPSEDWIAGVEDHPDPSRHVFTYENDSGESLYLMLFNYVRNARGQEPWRILYIGQCDGAKRFAQFKESNGRFAVIAVPVNDLANSVFLGSVDVYAKDDTEMLIKSTASTLIAEIK